MIFTALFPVSWYSKKKTTSLPHAHSKDTDCIRTFIFTWSHWSDVCSSETWRRVFGGVAWWGTTHIRAFYKYLKGVNTSVPKKGVCRCINWSAQKLWKGKFNMLFHDLYRRFEATMDGRCRYIEPFLLKCNLVCLIFECCWCCAQLHKPEINNWLLICSE